MKKYRNAPHKLLVLTLVATTISRTLANDEPYFMRWLNRLDDIKITDTDYEKTLTNIKKKSSELNKQGKKRSSLLLGLHAIITYAINELVARYLRTEASGKTIQKTDTAQNAIRIPYGKVLKGTGRILQQHPKLVSFLQGTLEPENLKKIGAPLAEMLGQGNRVWLRKEFIEKLNDYINVVRLTALAIPDKSDWFFVKKETSPTTKDEMVEKSQELVREKAAYYEILGEEIKKILEKLREQKDPYRYYLRQLFFYITVMKEINASKDAILQASKQAAKEARLDAKRAVLDSQYDIEQKIKLAGPLENILADSYKEFLAVVKNWPAEADAPPAPRFRTNWKIQRPAAKVVTSSHLEKLWYPLEELSTLTR